MVVNVRDALMQRAAAMDGINPGDLRLDDVELDPQDIRVLMISEAPPANPLDGFYSPNPDAADARSALQLLRDGGIAADSMQALLSRGIYVTTAIKTPKEGLFVDDAVLSAHQPLLESELDLFPNLRVVMLMGDVAKKSFNRIARARTGKGAIPSGATYKMRSQTFESMGLRVFPSYILSGVNLKIEKGKCEMIADDIRRMKQLL